MNTSHPKALPFLFLTEMWERFGFYVVQGLMVLYMTSHYGFADDQSYIIAGMFSALVYIAPLIGGHAADRYLGFKLSILVGGLLLIIGYSLLGLSSSESTFLSALGIIITGNGLFKPNISSLLGAQYASNDVSRDSGFTIFYVGINLGSFLAGPASGYIQENFGWSISFALASFGLIIGLLFFRMGWKHYRDPNAPFNLTVMFKLKLIVALLAAIVISSTTMHLYHYSKYVLPLLALTLFTYLMRLIYQHQNQERRNLILLTLLTIASIAFFSLFQQIFFSVNLYIDRLVDKTWFGLHLPTTVFYSIESIYVILLGSAFAWMWNRLAARAIVLNPVHKFCLGIVFAGSAFAVLAMSTYFTKPQLLVSAHWVLFAYLLLTIGELFLSPIGLSAVTSLAPRHITGFMMGTWIASTGFGGGLAGWLATFSSVPEGSSLALQLMIYRQAFWGYAGFAVVIAVLFFFTTMLLTRK